MSMNDFDLKNTHFVGYITEMTYDSATIMSHDFHVSKANFVPKGAFLLVQVKEKNNDKPFAYFLLRVLNISYVDQDNKSNKEKTIQKVTNHEKEIRDIQEEMNDPINQNKLSFYQLNCNLLGTFYFKDDQMHYGSDVYSFNVSHIYKVFKPTGENLEKIVNFVKLDRLKATHNLFENLTDKKYLKEFKFNVGKVRYASTMLENDQSENKDIANVIIDPSDFIKQKTAVFGMTRTGKSNTVKIIASSIIELSKKINVPIGQLIYDINGEYANDNEQNKRLENTIIYTTDNEVLKEQINLIKNKQKGIVQFSPALNNLYNSANYGLKIIQRGLVEKNQDSNYINNFKAIKKIEDNPITHMLWVLLLYKAGYELPKKSITDEGFIFNIDTQEFLFKVSDKKMIQKNTFFKGFLDVYMEEDVLKLQLSRIEILLNDLKNQANMIQNFKDYNEDQKALVGFIVQSDLSGSKIRTGLSGWQMIIEYQNCHCVYGETNDYRKQIYEQISSGKTVIIDLSIGDPFTRKYVAEELMQYVFERQISIFRKDQPCPILNLYIEEAHNVIGKGAAIDSLWPRIAKEGAKYNIGLIYTTQEPSAIHESILANTANFIVAHLNNEKEIKTISQYEDIGDFQESIRRSEDVGFVRLRLLSKPYTIPVQIKLFDNENT